MQNDIGYPGYGVFSKTIQYWREASVGTSIFYNTRIIISRCDIERRHIRWRSIRSTDR